MLPKLNLPKLELPKAIASFPDVVLKPTPAGPVPIPYPNISVAPGSLPKDSFGPFPALGFELGGSKPSLGESLLEELGAKESGPSKTTQHELAHVLQQRINTKV